MRRPPFAGPARDVPATAEGRPRHAALMADRAWVRLPSGRRLDLLPHPFDWTDADLATGLARTFRWGGHSAGRSRSPWRSIR